MECQRTADRAMDVVPGLTRPMFFAHAKAFTVGVSFMLILKGPEKRMLWKCKKWSHNHQIRAIIRNQRRQVQNKQVDSLQKSIVKTTNVKHLSLTIYTENNVTPKKNHTPFDCPTSLLSNRSPPQTPTTQHLPRHLL